MFKVSHEFSIPMKVIDASMVVRISFARKRVSRAMGVLATFFDALRRSRTLATVFDFDGDRR